MSLTQSDLGEIRMIVREEVDSAIETKVKPLIKPLADEIQALRNDVKEIYDMISDLEARIMPDKEFQKLSVENQVLTLDKDIHIVAKHIGVALPRQ